MPKLSPVALISGNPYKLQSARLICEPYGVSLEQRSLNIPEIQSDDGAEIARDKAVKAFGQIACALIVEDSIWSVPALGGFPGPYMASMNRWFGADDFARLFAPLTDRRIILTQHAVYQDAHGQKHFTSSVEGVLLTEPQGESQYPHAVFTSFDGGNMSSAEYAEQGGSSLTQHRTVWHEFAEWYGSDER